MISFARKLSTKFPFLVNNFKTFDILRLNPCRLCDEITLSKSNICKSCSNDLGWNKQSCDICSFPLPTQERNTLEDEQIPIQLICGECLISPPPFSTSIIPFTYSFPVNQMIQRTKYKNEQYWIRSLGIMFIDYLQSVRQSGSMPDILIPVPMHKKKLELRGFNQAEQLSRCLSKQINIPTHTGLLLKIKESNDQASLNKSQRRLNLNNCFSILFSEKIKGRHIALIDDVMTTKATSEICSQLLIDNGASRVDVWCLARTPKNTAI